MITRTNRSGKSWKITYDYWLSNRIGNNKKVRTVTVNSVYKPTRSVAERAATDDLIAFLGHSRGQYGYMGVKIQFIGKVQPVLTSTLQKNGTPPAIVRVAPTTPHISVQ